MKPHRKDARLVQQRLTLGADLVFPYDDPYSFHGDNLLFEQVYESLAEEAIV